MKLLACASYDYMKLMVLELQQQLADLDEAEKAISVSANSAEENNSSQVDNAMADPTAPPRQNRYLNPK